MRDGTPTLSNTPSIATARRIVAHFANAAARCGTDTLRCAMAEEYLANAQPSDYFAVALIDRYGDVDFLVPFTRDRDALRRAVATFHAASPNDPLRLTVTPSERAVFSFDNSAEIAQLRHMGAN